MSISRTRSPRYPSHALPDAIGYAIKIYEAMHRSVFGSDTAVRLMGFAGKNGASTTALGSVRQYGLIEGIGDNTRVTELALQIFEPSSDQEYREGVQVAARHPEVFKSIYERFDDRIPPSDEPLRAYLIRDLGFSKNGVDDCISALRGTVAFAKNNEPLIPSNARSTEIDSNTDELILTDKIPSDRTPNIERSGASDSIRIPLTKECVAELRFEGPVTEKAIQNFLRHLELMKDVWAEE